MSKLILPFDTGRGLVYFDREGAIKREDLPAPPPFSPAKDLGSFQDMDFSTGISALFGESGAGKSTLIQRMISGGYGYQSWGEPDPLPAAEGQTVIGEPNVLVGQLEDRFEDHDLVVLDSLRPYIIGGSGTMKNGLSGTFITSAMTAWHHILRSHGKGVVTVVNPQSPKNAGNGEAYNFALTAVSGSVGTTWEVSQDYDNGTKIYRQRNEGAGGSTRFSVDSRFSPAAPSASQQVNVTAQAVTITGPAFPQADMRSPFTLDMTTVETSD